MASRLSGHPAHPKPTGAGDAPRGARSTGAAARDWRAWIGAAIIAFSIVAVYARTFDVPFLFDDAPSIEENPTIRDLRAIGQVLSPPHDTGRTVNGRPALNLSFAVNYAFGGTAVSGYHAVNLLIHVAACLVLFGIARRTLRLTTVPERFRTRSDGLALLVALCWGLHPLHTSAVTYVVQRAESMMGLCYLSTLYCVIRGAQSARPLHWQILALVMCTVGMATKESMVTAPLIVVWYDRVFLAGTWREVWHRRKWIHVGLAGTWLILAALVAGSGGRGGTAGWTGAMAVSDYALIQLHAVGLYLRLALWPHPLVFDYGAAWNVTAGATSLAVAVVLLVVTAVIVAMRRRLSAGMLGAVFFVLLAPTTSILPVATQVIAEHRLYLPLAAVSALVVLGLFSAGGGKGMVAALLAAIGLGGATLARNETYRDARGLWRDTVAKVPANARAHYNYALLTDEAGRATEAIFHFEQVVRLQPRDAEARNKLAAALLRSGAGEAALRHLTEALRLRPDYADAHNNLGIALAQAGRLADALEHLMAVARLRPTSFEANFNLGNVLAQLGRRAEAIEAYEKARRIKPAHPGVRDLLARLRSG